MIKSRRITVSLAMLLISALLMGTASYAWFAMNTQTKAEGLEVEAYTDSLFLEISKAGNVDAEGNKIYDVEIDYQMTASADLRLVTASLFKNLVYASISTPRVIQSGNYEGEDVDYYKSVNGNYILVTDLVETSSTADLIKNPTFTLVADRAIVAGTAKYYEYDTKAHTYTAVEITDASAYGYYTMTPGAADADGLYSGVATDKYYEETEVNGKTVLTEVSASLTLGTDLNGLYTIADITTYNLTDTASNGVNYYVKNGNDLTLVGAIPGGTVFGEYLFWGRAYSTLADQVQENNTLTLVSANDAANYYLTQTLYLRCAEGTNNASNLKVDDIVLKGATNVLTPALRVLLVATSSTDSGNPQRISACIYNPAPDTNSGEQKFTYLDGNDCFFDTVLGNEAEEIKVDVYIYFDGTDSEAKNDVVAGELLNSQAIEIYFGIDELPYNQ